MNQNHSSIGLFLCKCGTNVASVVDMEKIKVWCESQGNILFTETYDLLCSPAGKKFVEDRVREIKPDCVVVAACSPKTHEKTFQTALENGGLNKGMLQMANIREHVAWVTPDKQAATQKAIALIRAALQRIPHNEALEARAMECITDVVIIGGGIAGIEAALCLAQAGRKVTIVEKDVSLGGKVIQYDEVAPAMECGPCLLAPRLSAVRENKNIEVITNAQITDVVGFFGNFTVKVKQGPRYVESSCIGCEACFDVCPVSVDNSFHLGLGKRKAVYTLFPGSVPATAVIDDKNCKHFIDGSCDACVAACSFNSINFNDKERFIEIPAGAVILAIGGDAADAFVTLTNKAREIPNVYTLPQFERLMASNGPLLGQFKLAGGEDPKNVAILHCAGSLTEKGANYCSEFCCMTALKAGEFLRKKFPSVQVTHIYDRLVIPGVELEEFYKKQIEEGSKFIHIHELELVQISPSGKNILVSLPGQNVITADMVLLSTGFVSSNGNRHLAELMNIDINESGFFKPEHPLIHTSSCSIEGIYRIGSCASPCAVPVAVQQARSAAGEALSRLVPGRKIELEMLTTVIDEKKCAGCKLCISVCPYKAISYNTEKYISIVNEALCHGCGTCAASCPGGAARARHFTDQQLIAEVGGILHE